MCEDVKSVARKLLNEREEELAAKESELAKAEMRLRTFAADVRHTLWEMMRIGRTLSPELACGQMVAMARGLQRIADAALGPEVSR